MPCCSARCTTWPRKPSGSPPSEAARILRPGGPLFAVAISRWAFRIDGIIGARIYLKHPVTLDVIDEAERTGVFPPVYEGGFISYSHRPGDFRAELTGAGLDVTDLVGVEGPAIMLPDLDARMADPVDRAAILSHMPVFSLAFHRYFTRYPLVPFMIIGYNFD
jgi:hypothetical protein